MKNELCPKCQNHHEPGLAVCPTRVGLGVAQVSSSVASAEEATAPPPAPPEESPLLPEKEEQAPPPLATPSVFASLPGPEEKPEPSLLTSTDAVVMPPRRGAEKVYGPFVALFFRARAWAAPYLAGRGKFVAAGAGVILLLLLVWVVWPSDTEQTPLKDAPLFAGTETESSSQNAASTPDEAPAPEENVTLQVQATPEGVRVFPWVDGELWPAQEAPCDLKVPKGAPVELTFAAPGHNPKQVSLVANADQPVKASLTARNEKSSTGKSGSRTSRQGGKSSGGGFFPGSR